MLKGKCAQESTFKDQRQGNNEGSKVKKSKKKIPLALNINSLANITAKRMHKASKSTVQPNDHRLFNSPILNYPTKDALPNNSVSFTHILEQNLKNHQLQHKKYFHPSPVANFQIKQNPLSKHNLQESSGFSNPCLSKELVTSRQKRSVQGPSKSPLRLVNANRMSNTPKLKQCKNQGEKQKTFKQLLSNKQNEDIRLQCSQKLFKYLDNNEVKGLIPEKNLFCGSAKSNLLSTCAINLSQRCQHEKLPSLVRSSKGNISNKSVIESSSNHEIKQFFQEDLEEDSTIPTIQEKVIYLKSKINACNQQIEEVFYQSSPTNILTLLTPSNLKMKDTSSQIQKLTLLKQQIVNTVQRFIREVFSLSNKVAKQIDEYIALMQDTHSTSIDWMAIQRRLVQSDNLRTLQCQNEILMERVQQIEQQLRLQGKEQGWLSLKWQAQLHNINANIATVNDKERSKKRAPLQSIEEQFHKWMILMQKVALVKT